MNNEAFYYCKDLNCGLYFREHFNIERPILETEVSVPRLFRKVRINLLGMGDVGLQRLAQTGVVNIWPVDLHNYPYTLDPKVSRTCSENMVERWETLVEELHPSNWKTHEEIFEEYMTEMENPPIKDVNIKRILINWIQTLRNHNPKINSGIELIDYMANVEDDVEEEDDY